MRSIVKVPEDRIPVLIGKGGSVKKEIENTTKTRILVFRDVSIDGGPLEVIRASEIVRAIGKGFNPKTAMLLLDEDYELAIIKIDQKEGHRRRVLSRLIGRKGKVRKYIEELTGAHISVYGKTVCIIGLHEQVDVAGNAVEHIIEGKSHGFVYGRIRKLRQSSRNYPL